MSADAPPVSLGEGHPNRDLSAFERVRCRPHVSRRAVAARATAVVLWLAVSASALSGVLALARVRAVQAGRSPVPPAPAGVEGFAELYVAAYLEDPMAAARAFNPAAPPLDGIGRGDRHVARVAAVRMVPAGAGTWAVTVGADVLVAAEGGYRRDALRYFQVGVARSREGYVATSLPGEVPAPAIPAPEGQAAKLPAPEEPVAAVVQGFFDSFLAGAPGLDRFLSTDALISPVDPPVAESVRLEGLLQRAATGGDHRVATAQLRVVDRSGRPLVYQYALRLAFLEGTWRVDALLPAVPALTPATR